jgi:competence protein ComEC
MRRLLRLVAVALAVLITLPALAADLRVRFIDVGQGDGILIVSPDHKAVLVDAGPPEAWKAVVAALRAEHVSRLDLVIATHAHLDHIGGMVKVLEHVPTRFYMDPGFPYASSAYRRLLEYLEAHHVPVRTARRGRTINLGGGAVLHLLAPELPFFHDTRSDPNANSVVGRLTYGKVSILLTGDAEAPTEQRLVKGGGLKSTVLKVCHHGSQYSSTPAFLAAVKPKVAVISVGVHNRYGHPSPRTLRRLRAVGARVYRTDLDGTVLFVTDGHTWKVTTTRQRDDDAPRAERVRKGARSVVQ